jgi:hypothetical protein
LVLSYFAFFTLSRLEAVLGTESGILCILITYANYWYYTTRVTQGPTYLFAVQYIDCRHKPLENQS